MKTKYAKKAFTFNVFLSSLCAPPLSMEPGALAAVFNVPESVLSGLRHGKQGRFPVSFQPELMASQFAFGLLGCFPRSVSTVKRFFIYAQSIGERYLVSETFGRTLSLFSDIPVPADENEAEKFCAGMLPALMSCCYEEAYRNTRKARRGEGGGEDTQTRPAETGMDYQERTKLFLKLIYAEGMIRDRPQDFIDIGYLEKIGTILLSQLHMPYFRMIRRRERISLSVGQDFVLFEIAGEAEMLFPQAVPADFILKQTVYHEAGLPEEQAAARAFSGFSCKVDGVPLADYLNPQHRAAPDLRAVREERCEGVVCSEIRLSFRIRPEEASHPVRVTYRYKAKSCCAERVSNVYFYSLCYPCENFLHTVQLSPSMRANWALRVNPVAFDNFGGFMRDETLRNTVGRNGDLYRISFQNWAVPGTGYMYSLYRRGVLPLL